ncbi:hypothetical protein ABB02_00213 [Clostridiaceae bacterium JG1575]|nr:hypothetical protein ABB02_00213 [Clostridiaceae bacterium JG1575]
MKRLLSLLVAGLVFISSVPAYATGRGNESQATPSVREATPLDPQIAAAFDRGEELVPVIVYMKEFPQLEGSGSLLKNREPEQFNRVIDALKSVTDRSQQPLRQALNREILAGKAASVESYFSANALSLKAAKSVVEAIAARPDVSKVIYDRIVPLEKPRIQKSADKAHHQKDPNVEWNVSRVGADLLWKEGITGEGVVVGIIDSGVDGNHPALARKWAGHGKENWRDYWLDAMDGKKFPYDESTVPHGTHCTGSILGSEENGTNQIGVAPGARWIAAKAFSPQGGTLGALLKAGDFMAAKKPDIVSNSWGQGAGEDDFYERTIKSWRAVGIIPVFAAGNASLDSPQKPGSIGAPANYLNVIAVGATDLNDRLGSFSLLGPSPYDPSKIKPDVSAPGVDIRSSISGGGYEDGWSGTSMATPHVSGVLALLKQKYNADKTNEELVQFFETLLRDTATPKTDEKFYKAPNMGYGYGLVDAHRAYHKMMQKDLGNVKGIVHTASAEEGKIAIEHQQTSDKAYMNWDLELEAKVTDTVALGDVSVEVVMGGATKTYPMVQKSGNAQSGVFSYTIPREELKEGKLSYTFHAENFHKKKSQSGPHFIHVLFGVKPGEYQEDFESYPSGFNWMNDWEWGEPAKEPYGGPKTHSGTKVMATKLRGPYSNGKVSLMYTPPIDLRVQKKAYLSFWSWHDIRRTNNSDYAQIEISKDYGKTWEKPGVEFRGHSMGWKETIINLAPYADDKNPIIVSFDLLADRSDAGDGWVIDDVSVKVPDETPPPNVQGLELVDATINGITLEWKKVNDPSVDTYVISRADASSQEYKVVAETQNLKWTDGHTFPNSHYKYQVVAKNFAGILSLQPAQIQADSLKGTILRGGSFRSTYRKHFITGGINNTWEYGQPEWDETNRSNPSKPPNGEYVWGTNLKGDYDKSSNSYIEFDMDTDLPNEGYSYLNYNHWYDIAPDGDHFADYGVIQVSTDGGTTWKNVSKKYRNEKLYWSLAEVDLTEFKGQRIKVRFTMISDDLFQFKGWYLSSAILYNTQQPMKPIFEPEPYAKGDAQAQKGSKNLRKRPKVVHQMKRTAPKAALQALHTAPVQAKVSVLETGRYAVSSDRTGRFELNHPVGRFTLRASAYGFTDLDQSVTIAKDQAVSAEFLLVPKPQNKVQGKVVDSISKKPLSGAKVRLKGDARIAEATTNDQGLFTLPKVYIGSDTLVIHHTDHKEARLDITVTPGEDPSHTIAMVPFVGYSKEEGFDDGSGENAILFGQKVAGIVVFEPKDFVKLEGVRVHMAADFPTPGGTEAAVVIQRIGEDGKPKGFVGTPKMVQFNRGGWTDIDLSEYDFGTSGRFGVGVLQTKDTELSPAISVDTKGKNFVYQKNSYRSVGHSMMLIERMGVLGNLMIRAKMQKSLQDISFENLGVKNYAKDKEFEVTGHVPADCDVNVYLNGKKVQTVTAKNNRFKTKVILDQDVNELSASALKQGVETEQTQPVEIILDQEAPVLTVSNPAANGTVKDRFLETKGRVTDKYLESFTLNGEAIALKADGTFSHEMILKKGKNVLRYVALDRAGNQTLLERSITVDDSASPLDPLDPATLTVTAPLEDVKVKATDLVRIAAKAEKEGTVSFQLGLTQTPAQEGWTPMTKKAGAWEGTLTIPQKILGTFYVHLRLEADGQKVYQVAPGRVQIVTGAPEEGAIERICGKDRYETALKLAKTFPKGGKVYLASGETLVDSTVVGPLARQEKAPILLTPKKQLPENVLTALKELMPSQVVIVGGPRSVSEDVEKMLKKEGLKGSRLMGETRYETALEVAKKLKVNDRFFIASGLSAADALSVGVYGVPILLTPSKELPPNVLETLKGAKEVTLLGGTVALSGEIEKQLGSIPHKRFAGKDRLETNQLVLSHFAPNASVLTVANGYKLTDALTAAPLGNPILLVDQKGLLNNQKSYLKDAAIGKILILGGELAVSPALEKQLQGYLK